MKYFPVTWTLLSAFTAVLASVMMYLVAAAFDLSGRTVSFRPVIRGMMATVLGGVFFFIAVFLYIVIFVLISPFARYAAGSGGPAFSILLAFTAGAGIGLAVFTAMMELQHFVRLSELVHSQSLTNGIVGISSIVTGILLAVSFVNSSGVAGLTGNPFFIAGIALTAIMCGLLAAERGMLWNNIGAGNRYGVLIFLTALPLVLCLPLLFYYRRFFAIYNVTPADLMTVVSFSFITAFKIIAFYALSGGLLFGFVPYNGVDNKN